jgi:hypothetical protein
MSKGILIFAHNNREIDYGKMAYISALYAKKNLRVPVSLVTDSGTKKWMIENNSIPIDDVFDKVILTDDIKLNIITTRRYYDGSLEYKKAEFKNGHRAWAYEFSPYDKTIVVDVDLLIVNDRLTSVWDTDSDFMINKYSHDLSRDRDNFEFIRVSDHGIDFFWATAFYFEKTEWTKTFFDLCQHIIENYEYYRFVYRINNPLMRNDYVFSIAIHIMGGFTNKINPPSLPCEIYYTVDRDELLKVNNEKSFTFLIQKKGCLGEYTLARTENQNIHIMNKYSINRLEKELLEAVNV